MSEDPAASPPDGARDEVNATIARLRHVLASITEGYFALDASFRFVEINEAARRLLSPERSDEDVPGEDVPGDVIGRGLWEVCAEEGSSEFYAQCRLAMESGREVHLETRTTGAPRWFETHLYPRPAEGRLEVYVRDVTDRRRAEEALAASEREFRAVFELSATGATQIDAATGRFVRVNRRFCEIVGYREDELIGMTSLDLTHPDDRARGADATGPVLRGEREAWEIENRYVRKDGRLVWAMVTGRLVRDAEGRPFRTIATIVDVTIRREAEEKLREADRRKDEFLATLAHELRNPLAPIANAMHLLRRAEGGPIAPPVARTYDVIERQLQQLTRLVDDLLDVSRITRGKVELRRARFDLAAALDRAVETTRPAIDAARHRFVSDVPRDVLFVDGDLARIAQVVGNLLHNAAKYNPPGGHIRLQAGRDGDAAVVRVIDDGIGLVAEHLSRIFEPFAQVDYDPARAQGGLGIGLSIVKRLTELHGGSVEARSEGLGRGSEFIVRLPLATEAEEAEPAPASAAWPTSSLAPLRVLVVDDNSDSADTLAQVIAAQGHDVRVAYSGFAALDMAWAARPDVVLLDLGMPGMSGFDVVRELRARPETANTYIVATTGWGQAADRRNTRKAGFDQHLVKPLDLATLAALLSTRARHGRR